MRKLSWSPRSLAVLMLVLSALSTHARAQELFPRGRTRAVVVSARAWADRAFGAPDPGPRLDGDLVNVLAANARSRADVVGLTDAQATLANVRASLARQAAATARGETLVVYLGGIGGRLQNGAPYLATFDTASNALPTTALTGPDIARHLAGRPFQGALIVLLADAAPAGVALAAADELSRAGVPVVALASVEASNAAPLTWTFTRTLLSVLGGDPLADRNGDRQLTLDELALELRDAMKFLDRQRLGQFDKGQNPQLLVARVRGGAKKARTPDAGSYVLVPGEDRRQAFMGRVVKRTKGEVLVRLVTMPNAPIDAFESGDVQPVTFRTFPVKSRLRIRSGAGELVGRVRLLDDVFHSMQYKGQPWLTEWVADERILGVATHVVPPPPPPPPPPTAQTLTPVNPPEAVQVEIDGRWWSGVLTAKMTTPLNVLWCVRVPMGPRTFEECVQPARVRRPEAPPPVVPVNPFPPGALVQVDWKGKWYPAIVKEAEPTRWHIRYEGWSEMWNEWVTIDRIKAR